MKGVEKIIPKTGLTSSSVGKCGNKYSFVHCQKDGINPRQVKNKKPTNPSQKLNFFSLFNRVAIRLRPKKISNDKTAMLTANIKPNVSKAVE
jgi:hypothetical protein